jgi:hypothetical protein
MKNPKRNRFHISCSALLRPDAAAAEPRPAKPTGGALLTRATCSIFLVIAIGAIHGADSTTNGNQRPSATPARAATGSVHRAAEPSSATPPLFAQYCFPCHGTSGPMAGISIEKVATGQTSIGDGFALWVRVATALEQHAMPPEGMPQPEEKDRAAAAAWIHSQLNAYAKLHDGDPGRVTVRRLTSGEYAYAMYDLTGYNFDTGIDASSDSVGGEGFSNFGDVQFMQDVNLEHYLNAAKLVADHAVIGAGPLEFYSDAGKTGFELSAITRVKDIYTKYGFRTVSGEGGYPYGLEKYGKVFFVTWEYAHRAALGQPAATLKTFADREGIEVRFAQHILDVVNRPTLAYPSSEIADRWHKLSAPTADIKASVEKARAETTDLQNFGTSWAGWFFGRGDEAFGGQGDESPLIFNDKSLKADPEHHFTFNHRGVAVGASGRGATAATGPVKIYLNVASVNPAAKGRGAIIWKNATVAFSNGIGRGGAGGASGATAASGVVAATNAAVAASGAGGRGRGAAGGSGGALVAGVGGASGVGRGRGRGPAPTQVSLRSIVTAETAKQLNFGRSIDGSNVGPDDFSTEGSVSFEVPVPQGMSSFTIQLDGALGKDRNHVFRVTISDRPDPRGIPIRGLIGDPATPGYKQFKDGVMEFATILPPNSNDQPTPADKDPAPEPFDPTYNVPEHDDYINWVKYIRGDRFVWEHLLNDEMRVRLDSAWNDVYASFPYHDNYLRLLGEKFKYDLKGKKMADMTPAAMAALPPEMRQYVTPLRQAWEGMVAAQAAAKPRHIEDCIRFASRAWRRPLTEAEKLSLRAFMARTEAVDPNHDHVAAIRAVIARILVAPQFLYKVELTSQSTAPRPLSNYEMASRLSFFLWSSIPDDELRRAAAAGELVTNAGLRKQVKRMLADPKARRLSTEFFGQWLGFYRFDQYKGVDTGRYPEFTDEVKASMYDQAVSFFEHIVRTNRPVSDILWADYDFLNKPLAKYYGLPKEVESTGPVELVEGANALNRGGVLRLGAVLTTTSAPLRTSPVKRGDWVLRRILGTPTPPPPADAGTIPSDDKLFGGLSVKERMAAHKRNATCAACHTRIDPLGFPLEHYDSTGRWRDKYSDGKPIDDVSELANKTPIPGATGLLDYLRTQGDKVGNTLARKILGYALGRTVQGSDQLLIDRMIRAGDRATIADLATMVVTSAQFRNIAGNEPAAQATVASSIPNRAAKPTVAKHAQKTNGANDAALPNGAVASIPAPAPLSAAAAKPPAPLAAIGPQISDKVGAP